MDISKLCLWILQTYPYILYEKLQRCSRACNHTVAEISKMIKIYLINILHRSASYEFSVMLVVNLSSFKTKKTGDTVLILNFFNTKAQPKNFNT